MAGSDLFTVLKMGEAFAFCQSNGSSPISNDFWKSVVEVALPVLHMFLRLLLLYSLDLVLSVVLVLSIVSQFPQLKFGLVAYIWLVNCSK